MPFFYGGNLINFLKVSERHWFIVNGVIASIFFLSSVLSPDHPLHEGLAQRQTNGNTKVFFSQVQFQRDLIGSELGLSQTSNLAYGPVQPIQMVSSTQNGGFWAGVGFYNEIPLHEDAFLGFYFLPGIYGKFNEVDLGGWLMFRSGIEVGKTIGKNWTISLAYDHRSSGDLWAYNPGMETWQLVLGKKFGETHN